MGTWEQKVNKYAAGHNFAAGQKDRMENKGCEQKEALGQNHKYGINYLTQKHILLIINP